jgi:hypothetical protein
MAASDCVILWSGAFVASPLGGILVFTVSSTFNLFLYLAFLAESSWLALHCVVANGEFMYTSSS